LGWCAGLEFWQSFAWFAGRLETTEARSVKVSAGRWLAGTSGRLTPRKHALRDGAGAVGSVPLARPPSATILFLLLLGGNVFASNVPAISFRSFGNVLKTCGDGNYGARGFSIFGIVSEILGTAGKGRKGHKMGTRGPEFRQSFARFSGGDLSDGFHLLALPPAALPPPRWARMMRGGAGAGGAGVETNFGNVSVLFAMAAGFRFEFRR